MANSYADITRTFWKLALDSPVVMAARIQRFSLPGAMSSARDRSEFTRMHVEKQAAAIESFASLWISAVMYQQKFWLALASGRFNVWPGPAAIARSAQSALRPYQRRASANAVRLSGR